MLAAFVTELYAEAEKGGRRTDKIKRGPSWLIKRMDLGVSNAENPQSWHCDNRNVDDASSFPSPTSALLPSLTFR
jgi:hypothetical protein